MTTQLDRAAPAAHRTHRLPFTALNIRRILDGPKRMTRRLSFHPAVGDFIAATEHYYQRGSWQPVPGVVTRTGRPKTAFVPADHDVRFERPAEPGWHKRHPRFMPTRYSRMIARVTATKAERLQDITEADALLEGIYAETWGNVRDLLADPQERDRYPLDLPVFVPPVEAERAPVFVTAVEAFQHLWTSLYGDDPVKGWAANPIVIATSFEPVPGT